MHTTSAAAIYTTASTGARPAPRRPSWSNSRGTRWPSTLHAGARRHPALEGVGVALGRVRRGATRGSRIDHAHAAGGARRRAIEANRQERMAYLAAARVVVNGVVENRRSVAPVELRNGAEAGAVFVEPAREKHDVVLRGPRALKSSGITVESPWMRCGNNDQRDVRPITAVISAVRSLSERTQPKPIEDCG